jgi:prophage tail gpP-like protein
MALHDIQIRHEQNRHRGVQRGSVTLSLEDIAPTFTFGYQSQLGPGRAEGSAWSLYAGDLVEVLVDNEVLVDGFITKSSIKRTAQEHTFQADGRAATIDLVECEYLKRPRAFTNITVSQLVTKLVEPWNFTVEVIGSQGGPLHRFKVEKGEKVFEAIVRACRQRGLWPRYRPGSYTIELVGLDATVGSTPLILGENVIEMSRDTDWSDRFSEYSGHGSCRGTDDQYGDATRFRNTIYDAGILRYRPMRIAARGTDGITDLATRLKLERNHRAGNSESIQCRVSGWRDYDGNLWRPNNLHKVIAPELGLNDPSLLITTVKYDWDAAMKNGFVAELTLKRREAFDHEATYPIDERGEWR